MKITHAVNRLLRGCHGWMNGFEDFFSPASAHWNNGLEVDTSIACSELRSGVEAFCVRRSSNRDERWVRTCKHIIFLTPPRGTLAQNVIPSTVAFL